MAKQGMKAKKGNKRVKKINRTMSNEKEKVHTLDGGVEKIQKVVVQEY